MKSGVYIIRNIRSGAFYIGSSKNVEDRWKDHLKTFRMKKHANIRLQRLYNKYGKDIFEFELLAIIPEEHCIKVEQNLIDAYFGKELCLNLSNCAAHPRGFKHTPEAIEKIRISSAARRHSPETKKRISEAKKGKSVSPSHLVAIQLAAAPRRGISVNVGPKNGMYGKSLTPEQKAKQIENAPRGTKHPQCKLSEEAVKQIRQNYPTLSYNKLAQMFNVDKKLIVNIIKRRAWKHI